MLERRAVVILLSLTALFYWQLIFSDGFTYLDSPDLAAQVLPWYNAQAIAWHEGEFPLWDPFVYGGQPLLGQMQPGAAFPLNWPLFWAPLEDGRISQRLVDLHYGLIHLLPALFMFGLVRELGCGRFPALIAGLAFACTGFVSSVGWPQMLHGAIWLPLTFWMFHRFVRLGTTRAGWASAILCGCSIGLSVLSGHHQAPFFGLLAFVALAGYMARKAGPRVLQGFALVGIVAVLVAGLQLLPAAEYGMDAYRWAGAPEPIGPDQDVPYFVHDERRLFVITLLGLVIRAVHFDVNTFVGWLVLVFALFALTRLRVATWAKLYCGLAAGALLYAVGTLSPLHDWAYHFVPLADKARSSSHAIYVVQFALIVLAAIGIDARLEGPPLETDDRFWTRVRQALVAFAVLSWTLIYFHASGGIMEVEPGDYIAMSSFFALGVLLTLRHVRDRKALQLALLGLFFFEAYSGRTHLIHDRSDPDSMKSLNALEELAPAMEFVARQEGEFRFLLVRDEGVLNVGAWHGVEQTGGFLASLSRDMQQLYQDVGWWETKDLLGSKYVIAKEPVGEYYQLIHEAAGGWNVYLNAKAAPRAWLTTSDEGISGPPLRECAEEGRVQFAEQSTQSVRLRVEASCESYLVLTDPWWPGWGVEVDGEAAEILRFRGALRAVSVPAGSRDVEFRFSPVSVRVGAAMTGIGFLFGIAALLAATRAGRDPRAHATGEDVDHSSSV